MKSSNDSERERRAWPRRRNRFRVFISLADDNGTAPESGWVLDRSRGGLRLAVPNQVEPGTRLKVRPIAAPARLSWVVVQVKNCRARGKGWELGCKFVRIPSLATLLLFG